MATASERPTPSRRETIAMAIAAELQRQAHDGAARIDIAAMAEAIETAIAGHGDMGEGRHPDELNATNDD